jgi:hypothetical protein
LGTTAFGEFDVESPPPPSPPHPITAKRVKRVPAAN